MSHISSENLNRMASVAKASYTEADSYPVVVESAVGLDIVNNGTPTLIFSVQGSGDIVGPFHVPAGTALTEEFAPFTKIIVDTPSSAFIFVVRTTLEG